MQFLFPSFSCFFLSFTVICSYIPSSSQLLLLLQCVPLDISFYLLHLISRLFLPFLLSPQVTSFLLFMQLFIFPLCSTTQSDDQRFLDDTKNHHRCLNYPTWVRNYTNRVNDLTIFLLRHIFRFEVLFTDIFLIGLPYCVITAQFMCHCFVTFSLKSVMILSRAANLSLNSLRG